MSTLAVEAVPGAPPVRHAPHLNQPLSVRAHRAVLCVQQDPEAAMLLTRVPLLKSRSHAS